MLAYKTHSQLVEATASVMRWYALATMNASAASASRGLALWTDWLETATARQPSNGSAQARPSTPAAWPWIPAPMAKAGQSAGMWWLGPGAPWWAQGPAWTAWSRGPMPGWNGWLAPTPPATPAGKVPNAAAPKPPVDTGVANYRSAGGHAVAQVIMGKANGHADGPSPSKAPPAGTR